MVRFLAIQLGKLKGCMNLLIANPSYNASVQNLRAQLAAYASRPGWVLHNFELASSLLTWCFNSAWATALNLKEKEGLTHFLLWHADIRPQGDDWLDRFIAEMERTDADVLSAIVPIKDQRGLTSTAIDTDPWRPMRITQTQAQRELPETWTAPWLLFNTGLMLVDFRKPWVYDTCFTMRDQIVRDENGNWTAMVEPEDWHFSRQCQRLSVKAYVTRKVTVDHFGTGCWSSDKVWGEATDQQNGALVANKLLTGIQVPEFIHER